MFNVQTEKCPLIPYYCQICIKSGLFSLYGHIFNLWYDSKVSSKIRISNFSISFFSKVVQWLIEHYSAEATVYEKQKIPRELSAHTLGLNKCIWPLFSNIFFSETAWPIKANSCGASLGRLKEILYKWFRSHDQDGCHAHIW